MSYDLHLFRAGLGGDLLAAAHASYERDADAPPAAPPEPGWRERMRAVAAALAAADPTLTAEAHDEPPEEYIELYGPDEGSGLQIVLFSDAADLHVPLWHEGAEARLAWEQAWRTLAVLEREGGYRTYDPQLDRVLDLDADRAALLAEYTAASASAQKAAAAAIPPPRPWWKFWG